MSLKLLIVFFLALLLIPIAWHLRPLMERHPEQDQCTFGTGSTKLYEQMRAEAEAYLTERGKVRLAGYFSRSDSKRFSKALNRQLKEFALKRETATERWAAIHALLRSYGMEFDYNGPRDREKLKSDRIPLSSRYIVQLPKLNKVCIFCYIVKEAAYKLHIRKGLYKYNQLTGGLHRNLFWYIDWTPIYIKRFYQTCPQVLK